MLDKSSYTGCKQTLRIIDYLKLKNKKGAELSHVNAPCGRFCNFITASLARRILFTHVVSVQVVKSCPSLFRW